MPDVLITVCLLLSQENRTPPEGQNRLAFEKSPYLLQHAHNPVDWYPWGEAAFRKAARENKPIFLSIGYSTCHWCHVMETESFEDRAVADFLNAHFVSVKVDREERQDVDEVYMAAAMEYNNGRGGWPLTIFMGPDKKPFFAGTYFPRKILLDLLKQAAELWERQPERLKKSAEELTGALKAEESGKAKLSDGILRTAYDQLRRRFDPEHGGFGASPKFPSPHNFGFLLRYWDRSGEGEALRMVQKTLRSMRDGGIFDQVGLGFHRYSTDREWLVPHFEKMLYDQATLLMAYVEAYQATGEASFAETAREIAAYALGPLRSPEGAFYSAEDADSEGEEGKFYAWTSGEFRQVLGAEWERHAAAMDITEAGNLEKGRNILRRKEAPGAGWENARRKLFDAREKRIHPRKDDKILASWNGLMIAALAKAAAALDESSFAQGASEAAAFLHQKMRRADGRLLRRYRDGEAAIGGYVDDYASFIWGLLELYEATFEPKYLEQALALAAQMVDLFWDSKNGGFFYSGRDAEELIVRRKETYDGAAPSGNSVAALDLARLGRLIARSDLEARGAAALEALSGDLVRAPRAYTAALAAVDFLLGPTKEVVLCGRRDAPDTRALRQVVGKRFLPRAVVLFMPAEEGRAAVAKLAPYSSEHRPLQGKAAAYVCRNYACRLPTADPEAFSKLLEER